jgi:hypothetical protein
LERDETVFGDYLAPPRFRAHLRGSENQRHINLVWNKNYHNNIKNLIYLFIKLVMKLSVGIT